MTDLAVRTTDIPGLLIVDLPVHGDDRGWFKENWQRAKMTAAGLPDFEPVQQNVSFNHEVGVTRGIHADPWDTYVSVASGRVFAAWVDLREGWTHGQVVTREIGPATAVFVPRGVGNAYQSLEPATAYSYLVNDHWSPAARTRSTFVNLADPTLAIPWPIDLGGAIRSDADRTHPNIENARRVEPRRHVVLGAGGQLGRALAAAIPDAIALTRAQADLCDPASLDAVDFCDADAIINAAAYTAVDLAETPEGRRGAWATNVAGVARLVDIARAHGIPLVHISSDYVFDGRLEQHREDEPFSPLGVYGQTKAAGDAVVAGYPRHYLLRASWLVGDGTNFVATMAALADNGISPAVIGDRYGRLTFAGDLAGAAIHLLDGGHPYGTYNVTSDGPTRSWADIAAAVFELRGRSAGDVSRVSTQEYAAGRQLAPRPAHSTLDLAKIAATGLTLRAASEALTDYVSTLPDGS